MAFHRKHGCQAPKSTILNLNLSIGLLLWHFHGLFGPFGSLTALGYYKSLKKQQQQYICLRQHESE